MKILNTEKASFEKALNSDVIKSFIAAIGTGIGKNFNIDKCRYDKIIMMCFTEDTQVKLLNGTNPTFKELVEMEEKNPNQTYEVYSKNSNGKIVHGKAHNPRITSYIHELVELTLNNNEVVKCTRNHLFMLNDGTYKEAQLLTTEDCLMSMQEECNRIINKQIVTLDHLIPVYDITVEEYHNFALNSGVFVHNCDADVDGYHISNLILTFIYNYMRPLIENGYIYLTVPPLYKVITKKESLYIRDDIELKEYKKKHPRENLEVQRFKGLTLCPDPYSFY